MFYGPTSSIQSLYVDSDVVALISNYEALPLSLLEALSNSLPIIATSVGDNHKVLSNGNGYLIDKTNDPIQIALALTALSDPRRRYEMGLKGYQLFKDNYDQTIMLESTLCYYSKILNIRI